MVDILKTIKDELPNVISDAMFEGANIVLYTDDKDFFIDSNGFIREVVENIKKRVELRISPEKTLDQDKTEEEIKKSFQKKQEISIYSLILKDLWL